MKLHVLPWVMSLLLTVIASAPARAEDARTVTILYTGSVKGMLDACES